MSEELIADLEKRFPRGPVIRGALRLPADRFQITVLFGPSGCGKTTVLRSLAGLERPEAGRIEFRGRAWFDASIRSFLSPQERDVGFLFQDYALFPHLTVAQNVAYGLRHHSLAARSELVADILDRFQLGELKQRYPHQVSGGQQQRVALARVLVRRPSLLLLDEPLSALDASLRDELRRQLRRWLADYGIPVIVVTHDRIEAMTLADQIVVMDAGQVRQSGSVSDIFSRPRDLNVAQIVGMETVVAGEVVAVTNGLATVDVAGVRLTAVAPAPEVQRVHVCIKAVLLLRKAQTEMSVRNQIPAVVQWLSQEGPLVRVGLNGGFELSALVTRPACAELQIREGETVIVAIKAPSLHLIPRHEAP
jgi:molybdate transport system ATP-binding protein